MAAPRRLPDGRFINDQGQIVDQYGRPVANAGVAVGNPATNPIPTVPPNEPQTGQPQETMPQPDKMPAPKLPPQQIQPDGSAGPGVRPPAPVTPTPPPGPRTYDAKGHASDGSQSVGLDNPWKIGAFQGGTYDHDTLAELAAIADGKKQGSISAGEAAYVLRTVGFIPDGSADYETKWAASRKLDRYAQNSGGTSPWWHDPANAPSAETTASLGGRYGSEKDALDNYGWWETQGGTPSNRSGGAAPDPTPMPGDGQAQPMIGSTPQGLRDTIAGMRNPAPTDPAPPDTIPDPGPMPALRVGQDAFWNRYR